MKLIILLLIFFFQTNAYSERIWKKTNDWRTIKGEKISGEFRVNKKMILPLPSGEWELIDKESDTITHGISTDSLTFVQMENGIPTKFFEIARATGLSKWQAYLTNIIEAAVFKPKEGGCRNRQHYNYLKVYKRGNAHNCMIVYILDVQRLLNPSDYDPDRVFTLGIRNWVEENNIELPKIYLAHDASFFSMTVRDEWYSMFYAETPQKFANYKPKFTSRDTSEFHPDKIKNFVEARKVMEKWIERSALFHSEFEIFQKARKSQKLDLNPYVVSKTKIKKKKDNLINNNDLSEQLIKLNELYKSGVLTESEFKKAKNRILNN
tara:strand:- start:995 stop:1960 length:966 start_codon:yes stop_codon:yes gene_type:complete